jgi:hypothetical protein
MWNSDVLDKPSTERLWVDFLDALKEDTLQVVAGDIALLPFINRCTSKEKRQ